MHIHCTIIGGGITGLILAHELTNKGYTVIVLEKSYRLGGRLHTIHDKDIQYEAGAGRINENHVRTLEYIDKFGLTLGELSLGKNYSNTQTGFIEKDITHKYIKRIIHYSSTLPKDKLKKLTFFQLSQIVLGINNTNKLVNTFGYNAEFENLNAYDGLEMFKNDFNYKTKYYYLKEGFTELINRITNSLKNTKKALVYTEHLVKTIKYNKKYMQLTVEDIYGNTKYFRTDAVVSTVPKNDLIKLYNWDLYQQSLLDSVESVPLNRVYGRFPSPKGVSWFSDISRTTTDNPIRQFIPINPSKGLAKVAYSDSDYAKYWKEYADKGENELRDEILRNLNVVFPNIPKIPKPKWVHNYFWDTGVHMWKSGINSNKLRPKIQKILGKDIPFFIAGEAYSNNQCWVEGCINSIDQVLPQITSYLQSH